LDKANKKMPLNGFIDMLTELKYYLIKGAEVRIKKAELIKHI